MVVVEWRRRERRRERPRGLTLLAFSKLMINDAISNNLSVRKPNVFRIDVIVFSSVHRAPSHASPLSKGQPPSSSITRFSAFTSSLSDLPNVMRNFKVYNSWTPADVCEYSNKIIFQSRKSRGNAGAFFNSIIEKLLMNIWSRAAKASFEIWERLKLKIFI